MHCLRCHPSFRDPRCFEPPATVDSERLRYSADAASASDSAIAIEVNKHVEADTDGLDITSGLWLDHPQVSWLEDLYYFIFCVFVSLFSLDGVDITSGLLFNHSRVVHPASFASCAVCLLALLIVPCRYCFIILPFVQLVLLNLRAVCVGLRAFLWLWSSTTINSSMNARKWTLRCFHFFRRVFACVVSYACGVPSPSIRV